MRNDVISHLESSVGTTLVNYRSSHKIGPRPVVKEDSRNLRNAAAEVYYLYRVTLSPFMHFVFCLTVVKRLSA